MELIANSNIVIKIDDGKKIVYNLPYGTKNEICDKEELIIRYCSTAQPLEIILEKFPFANEFINHLKDCFLIFEKDAVDYLKGGLLKRVKEIGIVGNYLNLFEAKGGYGIVGIPSDAGGSYGGARGGPKAIRESYRKYYDLVNEVLSLKKSSLIDFEFHRQYAISSYKVFDFGDINCSEGESSAIVGKKLGKVMGDLLHAGIKPITIGGDHSWTFYCLSAVEMKYENYGIIHFDAHHDLYLNRFDQRNTLSHGNFMAKFFYSKRVKKVYQIGLRTIDYVSDYSKERFDNRYHCFSSLDLNIIGYDVKKLNIDPSIPYYITFDIDCLSSEIVKNTGTPVIGGISYYKCLIYLDYLFRNLDIIGADFMELSSSPNCMSDDSAQIISRLIWAFTSSELSYQDFKKVDLS